MTARSLVVVTGGLSQPSATRLLANRLATATERPLREAGIEARVEVVELRDRAQDLLNHLVTGFPGPSLKATLDAVIGADGLIAVSPIFSASYSGLFKLFFDLLERDGLAGMPVLVGATGGTARHSLALEHAFRRSLPTSMPLWFQPPSLPPPGTGAGAIKLRRASSSGSTGQPVSSPTRWRLVRPGRARIRLPTRCHSRSCWARGRHRRAGRPTRADSRS